MTKPMMRRTLVALLEAAGYRMARDVGDHTIYRCADGDHIAAVPRHREITALVVGKIRNLPHLDREDFP